MDATLLKTLQGFKITSRKRRLSDDDLFDRLNYYYTAILITIFSFIITAKQYLVGEPLQCWVPPQFPKSWEQYAENFCWVRNTYFVAPSEDFPESRVEREEREIRYYQWVPFVLALQALMFFSPIILWRVLNIQSGVCVKNLVSMAIDDKNINPKDREGNMTILAGHMVRCLFRKKYPDNDRLATFKKYVCFQLNKSEYYLSIAYLFTKLLFIFNSLMQFVLLDAFLGPEYHFYGWQILKDLSAGITWQDTGHFPRVTFCDFRVRDVGQVRPFTVQCVLVVNLFNEKIYLFLWFWFVMVLIGNIYSLFHWAYTILCPGNKEHEILKHLQRDETINGSMLNEITNRMKRDCLLVLGIIRANCGDIMVGETMRAIYRELLKEPFRDRPPSYRLRDTRAPLDSNEGSENIPLQKGADV